MLYTAVLIDACLSLIMLSFATFHLYLVITNTTSVELAKARRDPEAHADKGIYDHGCMPNFVQVFGRNPCYWWLPVWGDGPDGDGVNWLRRELEEDTHAKAETHATSPESSGDAYINIDDVSDAVPMERRGVVVIVPGPTVDSSGRISNVF